MNEQYRRSGPRFFRPEARGLEYSQLVEPQREAVDQVCDWLQGAMEEVGGQVVKDYEKAALDVECTTRLDPVRASRVIFLGGGRGTGKSTVYCALRRGLEVSRTAAFPQGRQPPQLLQDDAAKRDIVFLEPLDLEPLHETPTSSRPF